MASSNQYLLRLCSLNLDGFNNSSVYLHDLCSFNDIICVQEHWLMSSQLHKFNKIHDDFTFYGCSAMDSVCSKGILRGRPFGGVGFLYRKLLPIKIGFAGYHSDGRIIAITLDCVNTSILLFCLYLPCDNGDQHYCDTLSDIFGFIESVAECYAGYKCMILGDFNFECVVSNRGFKEFLPVINNLNLTVCDSLDVNSVGFTYAHASLDHRSLIDHVFVNSDLLPVINDYKILHDATNLSDHLPVVFSIPVVATAHSTSQPKMPVYEFRWDKGDLAKFYNYSGDLLSRIHHQFACVSYDSV